MSYKIDITIHSHTGAFQCSTFNVQDIDIMQIYSELEYMKQMLQLQEQQEKAIFNTFDTLDF